MTKTVPTNWKDKTLEALEKDVWPTLEQLLREFDTSWEVRKSWFDSYREFKNIF